MPASLPSDASGEYAEEIECGRFPQTRWSLVIDAQTEEDESHRARALAELCETYWYPLYAYVRRRGFSPADAEDATQGFFLDLVSKERVRLFSQHKGKLRAYLLSAMKHHLNDLRKHEHAAKRGGGARLLSLEIDVAEQRYASEPREFDTPEKLFEMRWSLTVLERAFQRVEDEYQRLKKGEVFAALKSHLAGDGEDVSFREIGEQLGISEGAARNVLFRMRKVYRRFLELEIAETLAEGESVEEEVRYLSSVFDR